MITHGFEVLNKFGRHNPYMCHRPNMVWFMNIRIDDHRPRTGYVIQFLNEIGVLMGIHTHIQQYIYIYIINIYKYIYMYMYIYPLHIKLKTLFGHKLDRWFRKWFIPSPRPPNPSSVASTHPVLSVEPWAGNPLWT